MPIKSLSTFPNVIRCVWSIKKSEHIDFFFLSFLPYSLHHGLLFSYWGVACPSTIVPSPQIFSQSFFGGQKLRIKAHHLVSMLAHFASWKQWKFGKIFYSHTHTNPDTNTTKIMWEKFIWFFLQVRIYAFYLCEKCFQHASRGHWTQSFFPLLSFFRGPPPHTHPHTHLFFFFLFFFAWWLIYYQHFLFILLELLPF